jgi:hypothetical protein
MLALHQFPDPCSVGLDADLIIRKYHIVAMRRCIYPALLDLSGTAEYSVVPPTRFARGWLQIFEGDAGNWPRATNGQCKGSDCVDGQCVGTACISLLKLNVQSMPC